jgi:hypothetical protein
MPTGLSVSDVVNVSVSLSPQAAQVRNFGSLLVLGDSSVIDVQTRIRQYSSLSQVGADFGSTAPEYFAATLYYGQNPQPLTLFIGRWAATSTPGQLFGGIPTVTPAQLLSNFQVITNGGVNFTVNGSPVNLTGLNFTSVTSLNGVASVIQAAFSGQATCVWDAVYSRFEFRSVATGSSASFSFGTPGSGTDISGPSALAVTSSSGGYLAQGTLGETIETAVTTLIDLSNAWYGLQIAATAAIADADYVNVAAIIEAQSPPAIFGVTTQEASALNPQSTTDLAAILQAGGFTHSFCQYSSASPYASASIFGRAFSVNFNGSNTTITLKFKQEPSVTAETLTETQAAALNAKNCNVWVNYDNATAILQQGTMANGYFFDEIHGADWFQNQIQTDVYNALYTSPTKIPQTDAGISQIAAVVAQDCQMAVNNGYIAPGVWEGQNIGAIVNGQFLSTGWYIYQPPISSQSQAARAARQSPPIQVAAKLAGAVHFASVLVSINR